MRREKISFEDFDKHFIQSPDGFMPVYSAMKESEEDCSLLKAVQIDMICEWRLTDGKVKFLEVPFDTKEQLDAIIGYLKVTAKLLNDKILERVNRLADDYIQMKHERAVQDSLNT